MVSDVVKTYCYCFDVYFSVDSLNNAFYMRLLDMHQIYVLMIP